MTRVHFMHHNGRRQWYRPGKLEANYPDQGSPLRGKLAKSDAHNLWEGLKKHEAAVLLFSRDPLRPERAIFR